MKVRGYEIEFAVLDENLHEHGPVPAEEDGGGNPVGTIEIEPGAEQLKIARIVLIVDGIRFACTPFHHAEEFRSTGKMVASCEVDLVESIIDVIEQVANREITA